MPSSPTSPEKKTSAKRVRIMFLDDQNRPMDNRVGRQIDVRGEYAVFDLPRPRSAVFVQDVYGLFRRSARGRWKLIDRFPAETFDHLFRLVCSVAEHRDNPAPSASTPRKRYRYAVNASICFDVVATNESAALVAALRVVEEGVDGYDVLVGAADGDNGASDGRVYYAEHAAPIVQDVHDVLDVDPSSPT